MRRRNSPARESAVQEQACSVQIAPWMHCASSDSPWAIMIFQSFLERNRSGQTIWHSFDGFANLLTGDRRTDIDCPPTSGPRAAIAATGSALIIILLNFTFERKALM